MAATTEQQAPRLRVLAVLCGTTPDSVLAGQQGERDLGPLVELSELSGDGGEVCLSPDRISHNP
jgi:hypothetical protein